MSYGQWVIEKNETIKEFGYDPNVLSYGSRKPVICICSECGIKTPKRFREANRKHRCQTIINGKKKCFKCKLKLDVENFSKNRSTFDGYSKVCKECFSNYECVVKGYKKKSEKIKTDLKTYLNYKLTSIKIKSEQKNIFFNLKKDYLFELYEKQKGKCYYTKMEIKHNKGCFQFDSISVDRLDPNKGYTEDNIVLCSFGINSFKGMLNESEFKNILREYIPYLIEYSK
jgi:hypothetical protein